MCIEIEVGGRVIGNVDDLRIIVGKLIFEPDTPPEAQSKYCCLCYVDLPATAKANGYIYKPSEDPFYAYFDIQ